MRSAVVKSERRTLSVGKAGTVASFLRRPSPALLDAGAAAALSLGQRRPPRARSKPPAALAPLVPSRSQIVLRAGAIAFR